MTGSKSPSVIWILLGLALATVVLGMLLGRAFDHGGRVGDWGDKLWTAGVCAALMGAALGWFSWPRRLVRLVGWR